MYSIKNARKIETKNPATPARVALRFALYVIGRRDAIGGFLMIIPVTPPRLRLGEAIFVLSFKIKIVTNICLFHDFQ